MNLTNPREEVDREAEKEILVATFIKQETEAKEEVK